MEVHATDVVSMLLLRDQKYPRDRAFQVAVDTIPNQFVGSDNRDGVSPGKRSSFDRIFRTEVSNPSIEEQGLSGVLFQAFG